MNAALTKKWLSILKVMKGDKWEDAHVAYYSAFLAGLADEVGQKLLDKVITTMKFRPSVAELVELLQ